MNNEICVESDKSKVISIEKLPDKLPFLEISFAILMPQSQLPIEVSSKSFVSVLPDLMEGSLVAVIPSYPKINFSHKIYKCSRVGCLGKIKDIQYNDEDVRLLIQGICRFDVLEELPSGKNLLPRVRVSYERFKCDLNQSNEVSNSDKLLSVLDDYFKKFSIERDWNSIKNTPTNILVSAITMAFPFHPIEKQALLETVSLDERSKMITEIIEMNSFNRSLEPINTIN